jgi:hypothetical protein
MYKMNSEMGADGGLPVDRYCVTPSISSSGNRFRVNAVEMLVQYFKQGAPAKLYADMTDNEKMLYIQDNAIWMSYTDDDGNTWANESPAYPGYSDGKYRWHKLGMTYRRAFKFRVRSSIAGVWAGVSIG